MIQSLEQNIRDLKEKFRMMQEEGIESASKDYFASLKNEYGQAIKNYNNALYDKYKPIIPTLEKGHELMRIRRDELFRSGDRANVDQVAYPTFFTNFVRNRMHIKLEEHLVDYLKQYKKVDVLGLDDIGAEKGSDFSRRVLQGLYDARLDHKKRTLFTSNLSLGDLEEFLGDERLPSRIAGNADVVFMGGQDMRVYS